MTPPPFEAYFDFDNTIAEFDVLDELIRRFSIDEEWMNVEDAWRRGEIGSRECLELQLGKVRVSEARLRDFLLTVPVDPAFGPVVQLLRDKKVEPVILSDCFVPIIEAVLQNHGIEGIKIIANDMRLDGETPVLSFPYFGAICTCCGNCKTSHLMRRDRPLGTRKIYVGDGSSDICPAGFCEILFAKDSLLEHYRPLRPDVIPFDNLETVRQHLGQILA